MIDTKELRKVIADCYWPTSPVTINEILDRLEAAESARRDDYQNWMTALDRNAELLAKLEEIEKERDALRDRITEMEQQEPVGCVESLFDYFVIIYNNFDRAAPVYLAPGAQPAPSEHDASVRKSWARFSHELHRSPDAPYPGMSEAFEQHFSQSFTDREWRAEAATWAAAWKAAKRHCAQPAPSTEYVGWYCAHCERGVDASEVTYHEQHQVCGRIITDDKPPKPAPSAPDGWKLVPIEPTQEIRDAWTSHMHESFRVAYQAMLAAPLEAKP